MMKTSSQLRRNLKEAIVARFNLEELRVLAFDLDVDTDLFDSGASKEASVVKLIEYLERRHGLPTLIEALAQARPAVNWGEFDVLADPQAVELLQTVKALDNSLATWGDTGSVGKAREAAHRGYRPGIAESLALEVGIPQRTFELMSGRVYQCFATFDQLLLDNPLPGEVVNAAEQVTRCVCRELGVLKQLNGSIPDGPLEEWFTRYSCPG